MKKQLKRLEKNNDNILKTFFITFVWFIATLLITIVFNKENSLLVQYSVITQGFIAFILGIGGTINDYQIKVLEAKIFIKEYNISK